MTLRTLLLGSAAAVLVAGGAQAADLGAEPVNYVKVCDAFGAGFYYAPGTDTCIKISGWTRLDINIPGPVLAVGFSASHNYSMYNQLQVTAASMTEYGPMVGYIGIESLIGQAFLGATTIVQSLGIDAATLSLGPLSAGYAWSSYSNNIFPTYHNTPFNPLGGNHTLFVQLSWALQGVGVFLAAEDYRTRDGGTSTGQIPDIVGGISFAAGGINAKVTAGWGDRQVTDTWGIHGDVGVGLGALGNLNVQASYSKNADDWASWAAVGGGGNTGDWLGVWVALSSQWSPQISSLIGWAYYDDVAAAGSGTNTIVGQIGFTPVRNFLIGAEVQHVMPPAAASTTTGIIRLQRSWP